MGHDVRFSIPKRTLGTADVDFDVHRDASKLGTKKVSNGSLDWRYVAQFLLQLDY